MLIAATLTLLIVACTVGQEPVIVLDSQGDVRWDTDPGVAQATVGTVNTPGSDYVGSQVPESVAQGLRKAVNAPDTPIDVLQNGSFWRCMDGSVYACFVGANLPCEAKANTDRTPTQEEINYCQQNPNSDSIPAVVTGRETVYEWHCLDGVPDIEKQLSQPDAQGVFSDIWYKISPKAATGATTGPTPSPPTAHPLATTRAQIVFDSHRGGDYRNICAMDADGDNIVRLTTEETNDLAGPWSPDGQRIAFTWLGLTTSEIRLAVDCLFQRGLRFLSQQGPRPDRQETGPDWWRGGPSPSNAPLHMTALSYKKPAMAFGCDIGQ